MGIEQSDEEGFNVADMISLLNGHIKDGYYVSDNLKYNIKFPFL
jgi:hypothetical protein